ncbi:MAG TPA: PilZ domain-containing protein [Labilithrix sp.]|jgi:Tfp pilus assembly protein PilZ
MALTAAPLGKLLVEMGVVSQSTLDEVLAAQKADKRKLGELLADRGLVRPQQLAQILSHQLSCPWVSLQRVEIGQAVLGLVPRDLALELELVPVHMRSGDGGRTLYVATADPTDIDALGTCSRAAAMTVKPMVALSSDIRAALARLYGADPAGSKPADLPRKPMPSGEALDLEDDAIDVVEAVPAELQQASILTLNAPPRFLEQCRSAVAGHDGVVVDGAFAKAAELVAQHRPCAIVVTEDVYAFDRVGMNRLALDHDAVLVVWSEDVEAKQLEPLLGGAIKRWRRSAYEKGAVLDARYELVRDLGGPVPTSRWEVRHARTGRRGVMHVAARLADGGEDPTGVKRQQLALARVVHPGAVDLKDAGATERGDPYVVVELLEGKTLEGLLAARGRIPAPDACSVLLQIADVLSAAHDVNVMHNDVRPENIVVAADAFGVERAKLSGWQSARVVDGELDARSEVLALGLVAFEALVGREPKPDELIHATSEIPPDLARTLERAITADADKRFATIAELASAIEKAEPHGRQPSSLVEARRARLSGKPPPPSPTGAEQRKHPRAAYRTPVRIEVPGIGAVDGRSEDISAGGLFVVTRARVELGTQVTVRFALPVDGKVVAETATVKWLRDAKLGDGLSALGLELGAPGAETKRQVERYVALMADDAK